MAIISPVFHSFMTEQMLVPTWEIILLLTLLSLSILFRAPRIGVLIPFVFTLRITLRGIADDFSELTLAGILVFGIIIWILGMVAIWQDR